MPEETVTGTSGETEQPGPSADAPCSACLETAATGDDTCPSCGQPVAGTGEHVERVLTTFAGAGSGVTQHAAGVSDRGHHRRRNEDAFAFGRALTADGQEALVAVVADGVASVPEGDAASRAAGVAAVVAGQESLAQGEDAALAADVAAESARRAVDALASGEGRAPACTYVAAVVVGTSAVVSWIGDSRAYWLAPDAARLLTEDDSWASEMVAAGLADAETAHLHPRAHVITRWLAADGPDVRARSVELPLDSAGALLLCSDGVWNHVPAAADLVATLTGSGAVTDDGVDVVAGSRALVQAALDDGGTDNATAVLVAVTPAR